MELAAVRGETARRKAAPRADAGKSVTQSPVQSPTQSGSQAPTEARTLEDSTPLHGLTNIGPTIARRLAAVGVVTVGDLRSLGVVPTYQRVQASHPGMTIPLCYYLYSLQGALQDCPWQQLSPVVKAQLRTELRAAAALHPSRDPLASPPSPKA